MDIKRISIDAMIGAVILIGAYQTAAAVTPGGAGLNPDYAMSFVISGAGYVVIAWAIKWIITEFDLRWTYFAGALSLSIVCTAIAAAEGFALAKHNADQTAASIAPDQEAINERAGLVASAKDKRAEAARKVEQIKTLRAEIDEHKAKQMIYENGDPARGGRKYVGSKTEPSVYTVQLLINDTKARIDALQLRADELIDGARADEEAARQIKTTGTSAFLTSTGGGDAADGVAISGWVRAAFNVLVLIALEALAAASSRKSMKSLEPYGNCSQSARDRCAQIRDVREQIEFIAGELARGAVMKNPDPKAREDFSQEYLAQVFGVRKVTAGLARDRWHQMGGTRITIDGQGEHHHSVTADMFGGNVHDARERFSRGELA